LQASAQLLARLIYDWDPSSDPTLSLSSFHAADRITRISLLLRSSTLKTVTDDVIERIPQDHRGDPLQQYIVEQLAPQRPAFVVALIRGGIAESRSVAADCVAASCSDDIASLRYLAALSENAEAA